MEDVNSLLYSNKEKFNNGKIPPQAIDMEEAVLGAIMIDEKGLDQVIDILSPDIFYKSSHKEIFKVIRDLFNDSKPIDLITISDKLVKNNKLDFIGGNYYLIELTQKVISSAHIEYHSRIIQQKFILRRLIKVCSEFISKAYDGSIDVFDLLNIFESKIFDITHNYIKKNSENAQIIISKTIDRIKKTQSNDNCLCGIPSGFFILDNITSGWQNSDLIIFAARPGMGKTAFILSMARNIVVDYNIAVALFSLEMSSIQLMTRLISSETGIPSQKLRKGDLSNIEWKHLYSRIKLIEKAPLFIDDSPTLSIFDLRAKCRKLVSQNKVKLIMIDYLQLMILDTNFNRFSNREQEISMISRNLKSIAKELNIPIIAVSQLSRAVETRGGNKRPLLSDLRESGAIEQDADIVSFIYRPDYYGFSNWDTEDVSSCEGQAEIIIAKHRNGSLGNIRLNFISEYAKFTNIEDNIYLKNKNPVSENRIFDNYSF